jgi:ribosome-binding factor A
MRRFAKKDKVSDLLRHAISNAFLTELQDPDLKWINLTEVKINRDLSVARIFYTVLEQNLSREKAGKAISANMGVLRSYLASKLRLKHLPELRFAFDDTYENAMHIEELIQAIHKDDDGDTP